MPRGKRRVERAKQTRVRVKMRRAPIVVPTGSVVVRCRDDLHIHHRTVAQWPDPPGTDAADLLLRLIANWKRDDKQK